MGSNPWRKKQKPALAAKKARRRKMLAGHSEHDEIVVTLKKGNAVRLLKYIDGHADDRIARAMRRPDLIGKFIKGYASSFGYVPRESSIRPFGAGEQKANRHIQRAWERTGHAIGFAMKRYRGTDEH